MTLIKKLSPIALATSLAIGASAIAPAAFAVEGLSANVGVTNNYIWRGLTQSINATAVQGGIDYEDASGLYVGTWVSNVEYAPGDAFSYENDIYFGYSGGFDNGIGYDIGYLYYNYDSAANFDFGEIYSSLSYGGFSLIVNTLANTEADEGPGQDFDFGGTTYYSLNYSFPVAEELELTVHAGFHDGDFNEAFNAVTESYTDYSVSLAKGPFAFTVSDTDLSDAAAGDDQLDNGAVKFLVSYTLDIDL
ncbi:hypothetical protein JYT96_02810 [Gammaproteobacteria bacterium AH-315-C21]|nr:hypothetical protein [Gammaproteobacteria bacterium AH-315-C21]PCH64262.1 MAG: hypothetical protein COC09_03230 [Gammaproteobacteria bacterium]